MGVDIIIPTYNEKRNIIPLINKINKVLSGHFLDGKIIIVDDNSIDGTIDEIKKFRNDQRVKFFVRKKERGLGTAILYGIKRSKNDQVIGMDADFNHPPELIPLLLTELKNNDLVVASRFIKGGGMENKPRYFFTYIFNLFLKYVFGFPTMDNMSGYYAIKRKVLLGLPLKKIYQGYGEYHLKLVWYAKKVNLKIKEIPVYYPKRKFGKSKSNLYKMFFYYLITSFKLVFNLD